MRWQENGEKKTDVVYVQPPYFMNVLDRSKAEADTLTRFDDARAARKKDALSEDKAPVNTESQDLIGKSTPKNLKSILEDAVNKKKVPIEGDAKHPSAKDMRKWLVTYGIGIDCSGFVSQALNAVAEELYGEDASTIHKGSSQLRGGAKGFAEVKPIDLRPGDTMGHPGHIRIVTSVSKSGAEIGFTTAESTSRTENGEKDIGPTSAEWRFPDIDHSPKKLEMLKNGKWEDVANEDFGRYSVLKQFEDKQRKAAVSAKGKR